ncbi:Uncharacterised protein [Fusobacterium necrophorum subsp. necrophorum]|nr:Uncharacterised protein [Fusobacterium necrophorum subsp. necrophorum]
MLFPVQIVIMMKGIVTVRENGEVQNQVIQLIMKLKCGF